MIDRYTRAEMAEIWSEQGRYRRWLDVELLQKLPGQAKPAPVPQGASTLMLRRCRFGGVSKRLEEMEHREQNEQQQDPTDSNFICQSIILFHLKNMSHSSIS